MMIHQPAGTRRINLPGRAGYSIWLNRGYWGLAGYSIRRAGGWLMLPVPGSPRAGSPPQGFTRHTDGMAWLAGQ